VVYVGKLIITLQTTSIINLLFIVNMTTGRCVKVSEDLEMWF